jgi:hypothetical protein
MIVESITMTGEPIMSPKKSAETTTPPAVESLDLRVRRLEEAVAGLQDTRQMEERVVERVSDKLIRNDTHGIQESASFLMNAGRHILPLNLGKSSGAEQAPLNSPNAARSARPPWWLFEAYDDLRSVVRMYFDPRYRRHMTWTAFLTPFVLLACVLLVWFWMPTSIPVLGLGLQFLDKVVDILLAFFAFKILSRELHRYRDMMAGYSRT